MKTELVVALIAGAVALLSAGGTIWSSREIEKLKIENEQNKAKADRQREISKVSEPLARSAYQLQSRLYNILRQRLVEAYVVNGKEREKSYVIDNTAFVIGQYFCWTELTQREVQFVDLAHSGATRNLWQLQDQISGLWGTDEQPPTLRIFAGEQRALGEALIQTGAHGPECMGYGTFLKTFANGRDGLVDSVRADILSLGNGLPQAKERLTRVHHALIDLLEMLDPEYLRFPRERRTKA